MIKPSQQSTAFTVELQTDECFYVTDLFDGGWAQVRQWAQYSPKQGLMMGVVVVVVVGMDREGYDLQQKEMHQGTGTAGTPKNELGDKIYEGSP